MKSLSALLIFAATSVFAAAPNVGVVDIAEVMAKYNKAIETKASIDKPVESSKAAIAERGKEVEGLKADLDATVKRANDPILNEAGKKSLQSEAQVKNNALQQRFQEYQQFAQNAQATIQQRFNELQNAVNADIKSQSEKVAKDKGLQLILPKAIAFHADASLDITEEIIKELNAGYKSTAPVTPAAPAAPAGDKPAAK